MCGIVGILRHRPDAAPISPAVLTAMRDEMRHRGPDGSGLWIDTPGRIGLGHRRLAIIDLDVRASQPMLTADGRFALSFNGEIYNHKEVRAELEALGVRDWRTSSDTEVLLLSFRQWGIDCLKRFRGMFAFALWDAHEQALWLVRDRIGVKPLYYSDREGRLSFASEIKALLVDPSQPREMDETSLFHFLSLMTAPSPGTMFRGISKLPGGCWLRATAGGTIRLERYWDAWDEAALVGGHSEDEFVERLKAELEIAVRYRGVSDVPVGVFLSGGIDSSTNAALFAKSQTERPKTFTVGYEGDNPSYPNEFRYAREMADRIGSDHYEKHLTVNDLIDAMPRLIHLQDEPIADPVCFPVLSVSKLARDNGVIVAQVGEGADELFAGYSSWHRLLRLNRLAERFGAVGASAAGLGLRLAGKGDGQLAEALRRKQAGEPVFWSGAEIFAGPRKQRLLSARMKKDFKGRSSAEAVSEILARFNAKAIEKSTLNWMTYADLNLRLPELLLMRVDKMSMGVSVECREPFLDHKLVGLALAMPSDMKLKGGIPKYMLKRAVRGLIPDSLIDRKKQGFGVPVQDWFLGRLGPVIREEIQAFLNATDVLDPAGVEQLFQNRDGTSLWWLYNLAAWHRHFIREWRMENRPAA
jgi:asparagine synthase (glutamine-hydrolysing)